MSHGYDSGKTIAGYSNELNPFNDTNLGQQFVWKKKNKLLKEKGMSQRDIDREERAFRKEQREKEIEEARKRRAQSEREKALLEEKRERDQREKDQQDFEEWEKQEETFVFHQLRRRTIIRLKEDRAQPLDYVCRNLSLLDRDDRHQPQNPLSTYKNDPNDEMSMEGIQILADQYLLENPDNIFAAMTSQELKNCEEDLRCFVKMDIPSHRQFWESMLFICRWTIKKQDPSKQEQSSGLHPSIEEKLNNSLSTQTSSDLLRIENRLLSVVRNVRSAKMRRDSEDEENEDANIRFCENVLPLVEFWKAKKVLDATHLRILKTRLAELEKEAGLQDAPPSIPTFKVPLKLTHSDKTPSKDETAKEETAAEETVQQTPRPSPSPRPNEDEDLIWGVDGLAVTQPWLSSIRPRRSRQREQKQAKKVLEELSNDSQDDFGEAVPTGGGNPDSSETDIQEEYSDHVFDSTMALPSTTPVQLPGQSFKYRPRKPQYANKIRTGYEWNKYNKTHYDIDNPPPKTVMGYRFNIYYNDLIDKTITPTYTVIDCPDEGIPDLSALGKPGEPIQRSRGKRGASKALYKMIIFHAGPPYEDIAFKIANKEWDSRKHRGFKSLFDNGVLQLHFNFRRMRYRR
ncbi:putative Cactus-binding domain, C-terminal, Cactin, central region [Blattamonas nauphoetae]|uniref:Splicing factor Cactin n=1 Tax=Blattamonas nauphoetae TaxID=2049346 RepID=A0ABQ9XGE0_9EUKA|nr:putative Cactus-binding domain, C-terminal, Cactin, central region [Blattamonas nauphoetae]